MMSWRRADDPAVIHRLVQASDRAAAHRWGGTVPVRSTEKTRDLVAGGWVHVGEADGDALATITVSPEPTFDASGLDLPPAERPWYQQRLAVAPACTDTLAGVGAVIRAITVATSAGGDVLRAETNPDVADVAALLRALGFVVCAEDRTGPRPRAFLQLGLGRRAG